MSVSPISDRSSSVPYSRISFRQQCERSHDMADAVGAEKYVRMSRALAAECLPFFAEVLYAARLVMTSTCPALAAIDPHLRVYFQPELVQELVSSTTPSEAIAQLGFVWIHEISHWLRDHRTRAVEAGVGAAQSLLWNAAADLEINDARWTGLRPPKMFPPLLPSDFGFPAGVLTEEYYRRLGE